MTCSNHNSLRKNDRLSDSFPVGFSQIIYLVSVRLYSSAQNPVIRTAKTTAAAPTATVKRPLRKYARIIAAAHPAAALILEPVLPKIAGKVIAASTA